MLNDDAEFASYFFLSPRHPLQISCFAFFFFSSVYSTWAQVSLGHCNLRNGAGTLLLFFYISFTTMPVYDSSVMPHFPSSSLPLLPLASVFFLFFFPSPRTCTSTNRLLSSAHAIAIVLSVCIQACVFPILSRVVVLLYMGLSQATAARVSHHLYDFAMI